MTIQAPRPTMPAPLPKVLIIDDTLGHVANGAIRNHFCKSLFVREAGTDGVGGAGSTELLAEVTFESGQNTSRDGVVTNDLQKIVQAIRSGWPFPDGSRWALVCVDLDFVVGRRENQTSALFGAEVLKAIEDTHEWKPTGTASTLGRATDIPVIMLSSSEPAEVERKVHRETNAAFIQKWSPEDDAKERRIEFGRVLFKESLASDGTLRYVTESGDVRLIPREKRIVGGSIGILAALRSARATLMRGRNARLLVMAERGAGKELFVDYLHDHRPVAQLYLGENKAVGKLVRLNLQEVAPGLRTSALTGHARGAFTGAVRKVESPFRRAGDGTLHLDEIGNLEMPDLQILLRLVENTKFEVYAGTGEENILCQIVMTTNKDIPAKVKDGSFPADLYDRLDKVHLPPLRVRGDDIALLFTMFVEKTTTSLRCREKRIHVQTLSRIKKHSWSGNVRELQRVAELVVAEREYSGNIYAKDVDRAIEQTGAELQRQWSGGFEEILVALKEYRFSSREVDSAWVRIEQALGSMAESLLETAIGDCKLPRGRRRTECVNRVLKAVGEAPSKKLQSGECKRWIEQLAKNYTASGSAILELLSEKGEDKTSPQVQDKEFKDDSEA